MKSLQKIKPVLMLFALSSVTAVSIPFSDLGKSAADTTIGVITKLPDALPSPEGLWQLGKNVIAGYPFDVAFKAVNTLCSAAVSQNTVKPRITPNVTSMRFILKVENESDILVPLTQPNELWSSDKFNRQLPLVILVTGWTTNYNESENSALDTIYEAYRCRGNVNFVAVDSAQYVDTLYSWSAFNTEVIGELIGQSLVILIESYPIENIHLIGHSLGAHIVGSAGRYLNYKTDKLLPRITGLDAANPCFNEGEMLNGLSRGDAQFVDVIHSNNGALGKRDSMGDADFYPNGLHPLPPGCFSIVCAHEFAWRVYAESVYPGNEESFLAVRCTSLTAMNTNLCPGRKYVMGYATPNTTKGNFFLKTNSASPFGISNRVGNKFLCN